MSWINDLNYSASYVLSRAKINDSDASDLDGLLNNRNIVGLINFTIIKHLIAPYTDLKCFSLGYIDKKGFFTNKTIQSKDKKYFNLFIKTIISLRRKLEKIVPKQQLLLALQQLLLLRESNNNFVENNKEIIDLVKLLHIEGHKMTTFGEIMTEDGESSGTVSGGIATRGNGFGTTKEYLKRLALQRKQKRKQKKVTEDILLEMPPVETDSAKKAGTSEVSGVFDLEYELFKSGDEISFIKYLQQIIKGEIPVTDKYGDRVWIKTDEARCDFWKHIVVDNPLFDGYVMKDPFFHTNGKKDYEKLKNLIFADTLSYLKPKLVNPL